MATTILTFPLSLPAHVAGSPAAAALVVAEAARNLPRRLRTGEEANRVSSDARRAREDRKTALERGGLLPARQKRVEEAEAAVGSQALLVAWEMLHPLPRSRDGGRGEEVGWEGAEEDWSAWASTPSAEELRRREEAAAAELGRRKAVVEEYLRREREEMAELTALTPAHGGWSPGDGGAGDAYWREERETAASLDAAVAAAEVGLPKQLRADMAAWRVATELLLLEQDRGGTLRPRVRLTGAEAAEARWPTIASAVEAAIAGPDRQMAGVWLWVQTWAAQEWGAGPIQAAAAAVRLMGR